MKPRQSAVTFLTLVWAASRSLAAMLYVDATSLNPTPPYNDWSLAATTIQEAVDWAQAGDTVLVTNGIYQTGGRIMNGSLLNRVAVDKAITVRSVQGPTVTVIEGYQVPESTNADGAVRGVYLTNNAVLAGFTVRNGATRAAGLTTERRGGGVYCRANTAVISNCVIVANNAWESGGGIYQGTVYSSTLAGNVATNGGGAASAILFGCAVTTNRALSSGGGIYNGSLSNCSVVANLALTGGGVALTGATNCLVEFNQASGSGGGGSSGSFVGCQIRSNSAAGSGGGVSAATVLRSELRGNFAQGSGGGAFGGTLANCELRANTAEYGGGCYGSSVTNSALILNFARNSGGGSAGPASRLLNCTVVGNQAYGRGGGVISGTVSNSIIWFNTAALDSESAYAKLEFSSTAIAPYNGANNLFSDPQLASLTHLSVNSPCRGAGRAGITRGLDLDGEAWANPPAIGCDEYVAGAVTGAVTVAIQQSYPLVAVDTDVQFCADITGRLSASRWEFEDGSVISNRPIMLRCWSSAGIFPVVLRAFNQSHPTGISATVTVQVVARPVHYVSQQNPNPAAPYNSWATAATNLQAAVDAASVPGALVLVSNGVFASGARRAIGGVSNRLVALKPVVLQSLNGPGVTRIEGAQVAGTGYGATAVRGAFFGPGVIVDGFTFQNGASGYVDDAGFSELDETGGGVYCTAPSVVLTNCIITNNVAYVGGGGARGGTLFGCTVSSNRTVAYGGVGGGVEGAIVRDSVLFGNVANNGSGGGAYASWLWNTALSNNVAASGGGAAQSFVEQSWFVANFALEGGGAHLSTVSSTTIHGNQGNSGGGLYGGWASNCVVTANFAYNGGGINSGKIFWSVLRNNWATNGGGGAAAAELANCTLTLNRAQTNGGGLFYGSATNCVVTRNAVVFAGDGGGTFGAMLLNCTVTGNTAKNHGGIYGGILRNTVVYYNQADNSPNWAGGALFTNCCTTPLPSNGISNFTTEPLLASEFHLSSQSPCRNAGNANLAVGVDLDQESWLTPPAVGCDEFRADNLTGNLSVAVAAPSSAYAVGFPVNLTAEIVGRVSDSRWEFGDGTILSNRPYATHVWNAPGNYAVVLRAFNSTHPGGIAATALVQIVAQPVHYVVAGNGNPVPPYQSWATAAADIQSAVDATAMPGALVLVSNGVYSVGARRAADSLAFVYAISNRVTVNKPITVRSVNGPAVTTIHGEPDVRGVYLTNQATLVGFTVTNGILPVSNFKGGGVWCETYGSVVSNCVVVGNTAAGGGGIFFGTIYDSVLAENNAPSGGAITESRASGCVLTNNRASSSGGGASYSALTNCILAWNSAYYYGGGAYEGQLFNCLLTSNYTSVAYGGGAAWSDLLNCTVVGNSGGGGVAYVTATNCVVMDNFPTNHQSTESMQYCCTIPMPPGAGNFTNAPQLEANFRLGPNSPCINSGWNALGGAGVDLAGQPRVVAGTVDLGAYEFPAPLTSVSYLWAQQYGLAISGGTDMADVDGDGAVNWQEWRADTIPTNAASVLRLTGATNSDAGIIVSWQSRPTRRYWLERSTNLTSDAGFESVATGISGNPETTSFTDLTATNHGPYFYRVGVN